jgi:hypothetical protein
VSLVQDRWKQFEKMYPEEFKLFARRELKLT